MVGVVGACCLNGSKMVAKKTFKVSQKAEEK